MPESISGNETTRAVARVSVSVGSADSHSLCLSLASQGHADHLRI